MIAFQRIILLFVETKKYCKGDDSNLKTKKLEKC